MLTIACLLNVRKVQRVRMVSINIAAYVRQGSPGGCVNVVRNTPSKLLIYYSTLNYPRSCFLLCKQEISMIPSSSLITQSCVLVELLKPKGTLICMLRFLLKFQTLMTVPRCPVKMALVRMVATHTRAPAKLVLLEHTAKQVI